MYLPKTILGQLKLEPKSKLESTHESEDPSRFANGDIAIELLVWFSEIKEELIEILLTSAL